jgi:hypothetical protein
VRSSDRKPGGQPGRDGARLAPVDDPDRAETADPPAECSSCHGDLSVAREAGAGWAQVWDVLPQTGRQLRTDIHTQIESISSHLDGMPQPAM